VEVKQEAKAVSCRIDWRRRDSNPGGKAIWIFAQNSGKQVKNFRALSVNREFAELVFEPIDGAGIYHIYYLPYKMTGSRNYPTVNYVEPENSADPDWLDATEQSRLRKAVVLELQSINTLHSFYPMEVIATKTEVESFIKQHNELPYILIPEDRLHPIKMWTDVPYRWIKKSDLDHFTGSALRDEYFAFQVGLFAWDTDIDDINIEFTDLQGSKGSKIKAKAITCYNKGGIDWTGEPLIKKITVEKGHVQALWMGVKIPKDATPGEYTGKVTVRPENMPASTVELSLQVEEFLALDHGDTEPEKHSRLRWLDSEIAADHSVIPPYTPIETNENRLSILGRQVILQDNGLPRQIISTISPEVTAIAQAERPLLAGDMDLVILDENGEKIAWKFQGYKTNIVEPGMVQWTATGNAKGLSCTIEGMLEFDGFMTLKMEVKGKRNLVVEDISFTIPVQNEVAKYMLGLGRTGGYCPDELTYKWDPYFNNDGAWIGDVNLGLQTSFRAENYERPLNTNFYQQKPLHMPPSWYNEGAGGISLTRKPDHYLIQAYSGERTIEKGETLNFNVQMLVTPFHPLETEKHWHNRYYHRFEPIDSILAYGGNTINVHHATDINPYINYPFMTTDIMKAYTDEAHQKGAKVKYYYTVRELSNICPEIWALKSLGDEILSFGPGGGYSWLQEHLDGNYIAAWFVPSWKDAAVINSGVSRWHNYYLEGLNFLVNKVGIDGLYIDDVAFDRSIMQRVRKILLRGNPGALIDLHSANQFNPRDGYANSANLYLEHFAYIDRLWFGEYFNYDAGPEYWLTEVSGIPFGLMGEMLWEGGNAWRGMLYGMTSRAPWSGDPTPIWKVWDDFGIKDSEMIGYWSENCPVKTGRDDILATVYKKPDRTLIALASWAPGPARIELKIDWESLGLDPNKCEMIAPAVKDFQEAQKFKIDQSFTVPEKKGYLFEIREAKGER